jgi:ATP-binding cassette, subfamily B, bacterial
MDKSTLTKQTIRYYWKHARKHKGYLVGLALTVPFAVLFLAFVPSLIIARILQRISTHQFTNGQLWASFGPQLLTYAIVIFAGGIVLWRVAVWFGWRLEMAVTRDIYREVFDHLLELSANFHANRFSGSLVSQTNKLVGAYVRIADGTIYELTTLLLAFGFSFAILFPRVPWIATFLLVFAIGFIGVATFITKPVRRLRQLEAAAETKQTGQLADTVSNIMAVKSFAGGEHERHLFRQVTQKLVDASNNVLKASLKQDTMIAASTLTIGTGALILAVASMVLWGANVGTAFLVITYTSGITQRLWDFARGTLRNFNRAFGDAQEMIEILSIEPEVKDPVGPEPVRVNQGAIEFKHMDFTHPDSRESETLFTDLNLQIAAGEKIGLVGHSGSGKTTLTKLLLRFNDVDSGEIAIDGQNIARVAQDDLRRQIAYVPQEPLLFHRTIRENIAYGKPDASDAEVLAAAKKAYADEFIAKLPKGYDTLVGERGVKLSGGQRQRIAIARAIIKDAPILVLDEATSALDSESEKLIQAALWELMKGRTAIVIAHRLSTIQKMDRILVLDDGEVKEQGTHTGLLEWNGIYAKLWAHQSGGFIKEADEE